MNIATDPRPDDDLVEAGYLDSLALVELLYQPSSDARREPLARRPRCRRSLRTPRKTSARLASSLRTSAKGCRVTRVRPSTGVTSAPSPRCTSAWLARAADCPARAGVILRTSAVRPALVRRRSAFIGVRVRRRSRRGLLAVYARRGSRIDGRARGGGERAARSWPTRRRRRRRAPGLQLTRAYLAGPQELSVTDGANDVMRRITAPVWRGSSGRPHRTPPGRRRCSSLSAQLILASSSKRAISSTMTVTSLPCCAAVNQCFHQVRIHAGAVDGLLDRHHVGIARGRANEIDHRLERLERMVQQHVARCAAARTCRCLAACRHAGEKGGKRSAGCMTWSTSSDRRTMLTGPSTAYRRLAVDRKLVEQELGQMRRAVRSPPPAAPAMPNWRLCNSPLQGLAQVLDFFLVDPQVAVAGDPELRIGDHVAPGEQCRRYAHESPTTAGRSDVPPSSDRCVGQLDDARQHARRLDDGDRRAAPERVLAGQRDDEIEALVDHLRKRVRRVEADRRQQRAYLLIEIMLDPGRAGASLRSCGAAGGRRWRPVAAALRY